MSDLPPGLTAAIEDAARELDARRAVDAWVDASPTRSVVRHRGLLVVVDTDEELSTSGYPTIFADHQELARALGLL